MSAGLADPASTALLFASFYAALQGACSETERRDRIVMLDQALARIDGEGAYPALARAARRMVDTFEGRRESMVGASTWSSALVLVERELERIVGDFLKQALRKMEGAA